MIISNLDPAASQAELRRLYADPTIGPLGCLVAAQILHGFAGLPTIDDGLSADFAHLGRDRLTAAALKSDLNQLLAGDAPFSQFARAMLACLRSLSPNDARTLATGLPGNSGAMLLAVHSALQLHKDQPVDQAVGNLAEALSVVLNPILDAQLQQFSPDAPPLPDIGIQPPIQP